MIIGGRREEEAGRLLSQSRVIVRGRGHLQDALCVLLQQRAPLHLARQQQVLPVQSVDELHL